MTAQPYTTPLGTPQRNPLHAPLADAMFLISYAIQCAGQTLGYTSGDDIYFTLTAISCVLLAVSALCREYDNHDLIILVSLTAMALVNMLLTGKYTVLLTALLLVAAKGMRIRTILHCVFTAKAICLPTLLLLGWLGVFPISSSQHYSAAADGFVTRVSINDSSTNIIHLGLCTLFALAIVLWRKQCGLPVLLVMMSANLALYFSLTRSVTGVMVTTAMLLIAALLRYSPGFASAFARVAWMLPAVCLLIFLYTGYTYQPSGWRGELDHLMTGRIRNNHWWLANYGPSIFGQSSMVTTVAFDNSVVYMVVRQGLVLTTVLFGSMTVMLYRYGKSHNTDMVFLLSIMLIYSMSESILPSAVANPSLFLLLPLLHDSPDRDKLGVGGQQEPHMWRRTSPATQLFDISPSHERNNTGMTVLTFLQALKRHAAMAAGILVIVAVTVVGASLLQQPQYSATARLFAMYRGNEQSTSALTSGTSYISSQIESYPSLIKTKAVLNPVIDNLGLDVSASELARKITASRPENTMILTITATDPDARRAADIANAVAQSLTDQVTSELYRRDGSQDGESPISLSVVDEALPPTQPSSPNVLKYAVVGIILGVVLAATGVLLRTLIDARIRNKEDFIRQWPDLPVMGELAKGGRYTAQAAAVIDSPGSIEADEIRRIRTNILFSKPRGNNNADKILIVTSTEAGEGKTTTCVNLAAACAEAGRKVLLIDTDLRHPSVGERLGINDSAGLTHLLTGQAGLRDLIQPYWKDNYHVLPAGRRTANPTLLLNSDNMRILLEQIAPLYDDIIIDTCPIAVSNDAVLFAKEHGNMLLVVGLGMEDRRGLNATMENLRLADVHPLGVVLNLSEQRGHSDNYYNRYYNKIEEETEKTERRAKRRH